MAVKKPTAPYTDLEDELQYSVTLLKPIRIGRSWLRPGADVTLKGKVIKEMADDIGSVQPLAG
jgi:hypothetical protein